MEIRKADIDDARFCAEIISSSDLGKYYFPVKCMLLSSIENGIKTDEFYIKTSDVRGGILKEMKF